MSAAERQKALMISIHAPREGCDVQSSGLDHLADQFQSTHPARGATWAVDKGDNIMEISIHAPREGCDTHGERRRGLHRQFQSTHPARGATRCTDATHSA